MQISNPKEVAARLHQESIPFVLRSLLASGEVPTGGRAAMPDGSTHRFVYRGKMPVEVAVEVGREWSAVLAEQGAVAACFTVRLVRDDATKGVGFVVLWEDEREYFVAEIGLGPAPAPAVEFDAALAGQTGWIISGLTKLPACPDIFPVRLSC